MNLEINNPEHLGRFVELNNEWIEKYFVLEDADEELANSPQKIIENGGYIFSIADNGEVAGDCALFRKNTSYELARMAVSDNYKGKGLGNMLMESSLEKAKEIGAKKIKLFSKAKLEAAIAQYKKYGFLTIFEGSHPEYARCNIIMQREIA